MALGSENFNATISLDSIFCFQGDDIDDIFDEDSEPYLWVIMVKIDGEELHQDGNFLVGEAKFFFSSGSRGNLGGSMGNGQTRKIPTSIGTWQTSLTPIPISVAGQQLAAIPGVVLCFAVLMEENLTPNSAIEAGHLSLNNLVKTTVANTIASMGLAGLAADAAAEVVIEASAGNSITLATAAQRTLQRRLKPIVDLFTVAAPGDLVITILQNLGLDGFIGTAIDADKPMGVFYQVLGQADLARSFESSFGFPSNYGWIDINSHMWNMPEWAYTLHGQAYAHHEFIRKSPPTNDRLQVLCTSKRVLLNEKRITGIGGLDNGEYWVFSREEAARLILSGEKTFFVAGPGNRTVNIVAVQGGFIHGRPWFYLHTVADQFKSNNLLELPNCPVGAAIAEVWY